ncbi:MAG TPA: response regulator [Allosphingosinicella sp.]|nr:response regulator [Allosphingosinicella sp.]
MTRLIHISDDVPATRLQLDRLLRQAGYRTRLYTNGREFLEADPLSPGCIILKVHMPALGGLEVHRELLKRGQNFPVIFLDGDVPLAVRAMQQGAVDFLKMPFEENELRFAVKRAFALSEQGDLLRRFKADAAERLQCLTPRDVQILQGLRAGMDNKAMARWLNLSPRTVEAYRSAMMIDLGADSLSEALRAAMDGDLSEIDDSAKKASLKAA